MFITHLQKVCLTLDKCTPPTALCNMVGGSIETVVCMNISLLIICNASQMEVVVKHTYGNCAEF